MSFLITNGNYFISLIDLFIFTNFINLSVFMIIMQACKEHLSGRFDEACLTCLQSKANIGK